MHNTDEIKKRIIALLQNKGPSLPVQISKEIKMSTLFISAFLSELKDENRLKLSNLKVGGTPLYLLSGQEAMLENFQQYLHPKEQEARELLKKNKILKDSMQDPAIRVALRSIKDFSSSFKKDEELYWKYLTVSEEEVRELLEPKGKKEEIKIEIIEPIKDELKVVVNERVKEEIIKPENKEKEISRSIEIVEPKIEFIEVQKEKPTKIKKIKKEKTIEAITPEFNNPLAIKQVEEKPEKIKPKSEFVLSVIKFLEKNNFTVVSEKEYKAKEYNCIAQINTELGPIDFLTQAKDKKSITDYDLDLLLRQAQTIPLPALMIYPENLNKKGVEYSEKYYSIIKTKKLS